MCFTSRKIKFERSNYMHEKLAKSLMATIPNPAETPNCLTHDILIFGIILVLVLPSISIKPISAACGSLS